MNNLIIQDTFDPYYAGRDEATRRPARPSAPAKKRPQRESEIVLPDEAPPPAAEVRRDRLPVAH
ncbi:MAG: hypothetical protein M3Y78_02770 [Pseudomonadota bacterium]|nr:hypothetical protein [Pseudomonadota bacterium]